MRPRGGDGDLRRAVGAREAARARLRRATAGAVALAVALGGVFAALAASATHPRKTVLPATSAEKLPALTSAPAPPLVEVQSLDSSSAPSQSAPATAPTPSYQPPVVSSGGS